MKTTKTKVTKIQLIKKGKEVFGDTNKFNMWLNTECPSLDCKPITLYESGKFKILMDEIINFNK